MISPPRPPVQIAWVTNDLAATESMVSALLGVRKWVRMPGVHFAPDTCSYRGEPADFVADIALSYLGDMQLELIAPVSGRSIYQDFLADSGPGLHHICVEADDADGFAAMLDDAAANGAEIVSQGVMPGGMRFAYVSAPDAGVPFVEIAHISPEIRSVFDYIKQQQR
ncbi:VOC family protein [Mycolicibacter sinensis]|jgi:catechol 2,3-dioxygenase-like lactoylglutathione lyase family enzyme|uniref:Lactoylglutathione lyase n=1 Tax=Mycolicibacter sinensis (strain JDM601) TaxID=875328 RepID=A0A1A2ELU2_MYCSD|nr:VOC family protein [Mycolicibacter sinensis]OBF95798.1 lactoylglutathione lyase [Mycolicibacter sinensis]OBG05514.1 lactoylglutathione lyase [Mycolicibacter sinensis]